MSVTASYLLLHTSTSFTDANVLCSDQLAYPVSQLTGKHSLPDVWVKIASDLHVLHAVVPLLNTALSHCMLYQPDVVNWFDLAGTGKHDNILSAHDIGSV